MAKALMRVTVDGRTYEADLNRLTFAEARAVEKASGESFATILSAKAPTMTGVQALVWVTMKRGEPTLKFADLDDRAIEDFDLDRMEVADADPTEAGTPAWKESDSATSEPSPKS